MRLGPWIVMSGCLLLPVSSAVAQKPESKPLGTTYEPVYPPVNDNYQLTEESKPQPGVPQGKQFTFIMSDSKIFPETAQLITVYVPPEYSPEKPAALWVQLDSLPSQMMWTFDNLIRKHDIPVTIAIGVASGSVKSTRGEENPRLQRSYEFDALSDRLARFLLEEVVPAVEAHKTLSGDAIHISRDPNDHGIGGASTGGIGAFTAAFQRPDYFRRVFTTVGTFVGMRGGEQEYVHVRKTEPRPIRIFMMDGANDEWMGGPEMGDWHMSNLTMERALSFAGYDVKHVWGQGTHNDALGMQVFPDALRWLWRDYPQPIVAKTPGNPRLAELLVPGEAWVDATEGRHCAASVALAADSDGEIVESSADAAEIRRVKQAKPCTGKTDTLPLAFSANKKLYSALPDGGFAVAKFGKPPVVVAKNLQIRGIVARANGDVYVTAENTQHKDGSLWRITPDGKETYLGEDIRGATGLAFSPDGLWLVLAQANAQHAIDMRVLADGTLDTPEAMYQFAVPSTADDAGIGQIAFDTQGWLYAATRMGVQVFDRNGRVIGILPLPGAEAITGLAFGEAGPHTLFVSTASGRMYKRKLKVSGYPQMSPPIKLPKPSAG